MTMNERCPWAKLQNPRYVAYHDHEWGRPVYDDKRLFEFLILEGAQAGLSWETILKRREGYQQAFAGFSVEKVAQFSDEKLQSLRNDERIIRNRLKIESARRNARVFLDIQKEYGSFKDFYWDYVQHKPILNHYASMSDIPTETPLSREISKQLKRLGMSFVGPTIIYAYMQATGMVNDHLISCPQHAECERAAKAFVEAHQ